MRFLGFPVKNWLIMVAIGGIVYLILKFVVPSRVKEKYAGLFLLLPTIAWVISFVAYPLIYAVRLSFFEWQGIGNPNFVGFANYTSAFQDYKFWNGWHVTGLFVGIAVSVEFFLGLGLAVLANREIKGKGIIRTILTMPLFVSPLALGYLSFMLFYKDGPFTAMTSLLGMGKIGWLSDNKIALYTIIGLDIWEWTPFCFLILLAGLQMVPQEMIEAAYLETNSSFKIFWHLVFPSLKPVVSIVLALRVIEALKIFDLPFVLTYGGPGISTESYSILVYKKALKSFALGGGCAYSVIFLIVVMIVFSLVVSYTKLGDILTGGI